jgi:hypothetical protein
MDFDVAGHDALEHVLQVFERIEAVHPGALDQRGEDRPGSGAGVCPGKQSVFPCRCHDPMQTLDGVGVQLDPAIAQEHAQAGPVPQHVADRLGHRHFAGDARQLLLQIDLERLDPRPAPVVPNRLPGIGRLAPDLILNAVQLGDPPKHLAGDRRLAGLVDVEELPTAVDHPNTIEKLHFKVVVPFVGPFFASSRQRRTATAD